jgi:cyclic pyranopterin phosphate synthase
VKIHAFDGVDASLALVPLAARRALDHAGLKLSLEGWRSLSIEARTALVEAGEAAAVPIDEVRVRVSAAVPTAEPIAPAWDPPAATVPAEVGAAFGESRPIGQALWLALSPLDRYALAKVAQKPRPDRLAAAYAEIVGASALSTHLEPDGAVRMVNVAQKAPTQRRAVAESAVQMSAEAFARLSGASAGKGDVLATARIAGIMAAKRTPELIPLCHGIALTHAGVELELDAAASRVRVIATVESLDRTGVEMEAMVAASVAALTVYDMLKSYDRGMEIGPTRLMAKSGGRTGDFRR